MNPFVSNAISHEHQGEDSDIGPDQIGRLDAGPHLDFHSTPEHGGFARKVALGVGVADRGQRPVVEDLAVGVAVPVNAAGRVGQLNDGEGAAHGYWMAGDVVVVGVALECGAQGRVDDVPVSCAGGERGCGEEENEEAK